MWCHGCWQLGSNDQCFRLFKSVVKKKKMPVMLPHLGVGNVLLLLAYWTESILRCHHIMTLHWKGWKRQELQARRKIASVHQMVGQLHIQGVAKPPILNIWTDCLHLVYIGPGSSTVSSNLIVIWGNKWDFSSPKCLLKTHLFSWENFIDTCDHHQSVHDFLNNCFDPVLEVLMPELPEYFIFFF